MKLNRVRIFIRLSAESALDFPRGRNGRGGNILSNARLTVPSLTLAHDHDFDGARTPIEIDIDSDAGFVLRNTEVKDGRTDALIEDPGLDKSARDPNKHDVDTGARYLTVQDQQLKRASGGDGDENPPPMAIAPALEFDKILKY